MKDPENILEHQGKNSANSGMIRFTENDQAFTQTSVIKSYLQELMHYADQGIKPRNTARELDIPDELADALDTNPDFTGAFDTLTPSRQRGYFLHFGDAKQSATRSARIEKCRDRIFAGKGYNER